MVARYAEKEATRALELEKVSAAAAPPLNHGTPAETFAQAVRVTRPAKSNAERKTDRSVSRATNRNKALKEARKEEHIPAYIITTSGGKPPKEVRDVVWRKVASQKVQPKCHTITAKDGRIIIKPMYRETADVLKSLANVSPLIKEDSARWPRVSIKGVQSEIKPEELQKHILSQNSHLDIDVETEDTVLRPIFKHGKRDVDTTNWVTEVNPKYYNKFEDTTVYIGFMRCSVRTFEEVTQCYVCLKYGHPASKCNETVPKCMHCSKTGHKAAECPAAEGDPNCANCRGKHSAGDKSCSARTAFLLNRARRTDFGFTQ